MMARRAVSKSIPDRPYRTLGSVLVVLIAGLGAWVVIALVAWGTRWLVRWLWG